MLESKKRPKQNTKYSGRPLIAATQMNEFHSTFYRSIATPPSAAAATAGRPANALAIAPLEGFELEAAAEEL